MSTLFEKEAPHPLADRLRPRRLAEIVGQDHLLGPEGPIGRMVASRQLASMILWGPPGCGKTTIARLLAQELSKSGTELAFEPLSAVFSGVADLRKVFEAARKRREIGKGTLLFVDEIHRFNRAQQDAFLPVVEDGTVILIGATTENPSFELIGTLLAGAHAGGRRGPELHPAPADPRGCRRHWPRRPAGDRAGARGVEYLRPARLARGRAGDRPMPDLSRHGTQIERRLPGLWRSPPDGARDRLVDAADAHPQRADPADARARL